MKRNHCYFIFIAILLLCAASRAAIINGKFEAADSNGVLDDKGHFFYPPEDWERVNYTAVLDKFVPDSNEGNYGLWKIDIEEGLLPIEGQSFVLLTTGDIYPNPRWASLEQEIFVKADQIISGYYFFGTLDWSTYSDWANITLVPADSNESLRSIVLVDVSVRDVGSYSSMDGWKYFEYTFNAEEQGTYTLLIRVDDYSDEFYTSYFAIDDLLLCDFQTVGDINRDCHVNLEDFSWMAVDWLRDCNDPGYFSEPGSNCYRGTDLSGDGPVDYNDLAIIGENWLE